MRKIFTKIIVILLIADVFWNFSLSISLGAAQMQINDGGSSSLGPTTGHTVQEAGETIAAWAIDFANKHSSQARYGGTAGYNLPVSDSDTTTIYSFHCVAFVSFVIHHALGIGGEEYTEFVKCPYASSGTSNPNNAPYVKNGFERVDCSSDEWQPGDIVVFGSSKHIGIISDKRNKNGEPFLIHNSGQPFREEDVLRRLAKKDGITGHFRWDASKINDRIILWEE